ncbi:MAG TPA: hypothetical protein VHH33_08075 [Nitrososphaeraceae archaeon]|nr:hypothetical protein [Nitrososphaeraceae archaeon]
MICIVTASCVRVASDNAPLYTSEQIFLDCPFSEFTCPKSGWKLVEIAENKIDISKKPITSAVNEDIIYLLSTGTNGTLLSVADCVSKTCVIECPPSLIGNLDLKLRYTIMKLWVALFLRTELQQNGKKGNGSPLDKNWIKVKERSLMK